MEGYERENGLRAGKWRTTSGKVNYERESGGPRAGKWTTSGRMEDYERENRGLRAGEWRTTSGKVNYELEREQYLSYNCHGNHWPKWNE
jgi:hypothetical protein